MNKAKKYSHNLKNIKIINGIIYTSRKNNITPTQMKNIIKKYPYSGEKKGLSKSVEDFKMPAYASVFYNFVAAGIIPTEDQFVGNYIDSYFERCDDNKVKLKEEFGDPVTLDLEHVKARLLRTYPSLIRDFYFYLLCDGAKYFDIVQYGLDLDINKGIDIRVVKNNVNYDVCLFVNSKRAWENKRKKLGRHDYNGKIVDIPIDRKDEFLVGNFYMYSETHLNKLISVIENDQYAAFKN